MSDWNTAAAEGKLNAEEAKFGEAMSPTEVATLMNEAPPVPLTPEQQAELEKKNNDENSNDIYRVAARVKNLARGGGASLTTVGDILCNTYTHVLVSLYAYAESIKDEKLKALIQSHEGLPADVIYAAGAGVKRAKT